MGDVRLKLKPAGVAAVKLGTNKPVGFKAWATLLRVNLESRRIQLCSEAGHRRPQRLGRLQELLGALASASF